MTNDDMLSQEEIDALLNINNPKDQPENKEEEHLSSQEIDAIGEIGNISFGNAATTLSTLLNQKVEITTPRVELIAKENLDAAFQFEPVSIEVNYIEGFSGKNVFVIKLKDAAVIADIMLGGDGESPDEEFSSLHLSAVQEAMNQMMGAAVTSMSTIFEEKIDISPPVVLEGVRDDVTDATEVPEPEAHVKIFFNLTVGNLIDSEMIQFIPFSFAKDMVNQLITSQEASTVNDSLPETEEPLTKQSASAEKEEAVPKKTPETEPEHEEADDSEEINDPQFLGTSNDRERAKVERASFAEFEQVNLNKKEQRNLNMLLDIPLNVTVELGQTDRTIKDILDFSPGSIIELDKLAGEPVNIRVNQQLVAEGEVVVIDENFGVRITDIISKSDRIMKLK